MASLFDSQRTLYPAAAGAPVKRNRPIYDAAVPAGAGQPNLGAASLVGEAAPPAVARPAPLASVGAATTPPQAGPLIGLANPAATMPRGDNAVPPSMRDASPTDLNAAKAAIAARESNRTQGSNNLVNTLAGAVGGVPGGMKLTPSTETSQLQTGLAYTPPQGVVSPPTAAPAAAAPAAAAPAAAEDDPNLQPLALATERAAAMPASRYQDGAPIQIDPTKGPTYTDARGPSLQNANTGIRSYRERAYQDGLAHKINVLNHQRYDTDSRAGTSKYSVDAMVKDSAARLTEMARISDRTHETSKDVARRAHADKVMAETPYTGDKLKDFKMFIAENKHQSGNLFHALPEDEQIKALPDMQDMYERTQMLNDKGFGQYGADTSRFASEDGGKVRPPSLSDVNTSGVIKKLTGGRVAIPDLFGGPGTYGMADLISDTWSKDKVRDLDGRKIKELDWQTRRGGTNRSGNLDNISLRNATTKKD